MCLLIAQPKGVTFSKREKTDYLDCNADGFGGCVAIDGKLEIVRIVQDDKAVLSAYFAMFAGRKAMLHFRMATHGTKGVENCHRFLLAPEIASAHNGILEIDTAPAQGASDTRVFCDRILAPIARDNPDALFSPTMREILAGMIGTSNRLMFMRADGKISIVNEAEGVTHKKAWLSNTYAWSSPDNRRSWTAGALAQLGWHGYGDDYEGADWRSELPSGRNVIHTALTPAAVLASQASLLASRAVASAEDSTANDSEAQWSENLDMILEDVASAWHGYGVVGVREWLAKNAEDAATLLSEWYPGCTFEQALALITGNTARAAEWLTDIITDDLTPA